MSDDTPRHDPVLGSALQKARNAAGLTGEQLAERTGFKTRSGNLAKDKVSKIESGKQLPTAEEVEAWAQATGVSDRVRDQWKLLAEQAEETRSSNYRKRAQQGQQVVQEGYTKRAEETSRFTFFEMTFLPRYLQIPDYTRAVLQEHHEKHGTIDDVAAATRSRQASTRLLYDDTKKFVFLIDEPVLRRTRFGSTIMRPQLLHLMSVIGLDNVTLAIYPSLSRPVNSLTESSFELFDDIGYIETALEDAPRLLADDVEELEKLFERYWRDAAIGEDARTIILDAIASLPK